MTLRTSPSSDNLRAPVAKLPALPDGAKKWPFADWRTIDDGQGRKWLSWLAAAADGIAAGGWPSLGKAGPPDREVVRSFLWSLFQSRPRTTWVTAARAIAAFAQHDADTRSGIGVFWQRCYPAGLPTSLEPADKGRLLPDNWKTDKIFAPILEARLGPDFEDAPHVMRHALVLGCAWLARGGAQDVVPGLDPRALAARPLPGGDESDATCILQGIAELATAASCFRAEVLPFLGARAADLPSSDQGEAALRDLADSLDVADCAERDDSVRMLARDAVLERLRAPLWRHATGHLKRADGLWSWQESACWFRRRGDAESVEAMAVMAGEASDLLALVLDGRLPGEATDAIEALVPRLRIVFEESLWCTAAVDLRSRVLVEVAALLSRVAVRPKHAIEVWTAALAQATGLDGAVALRHLPPPGRWRPGSSTRTERPAGSASSNPFRDHALIALAVRLGDDAPQFLLRDRQFDREATLRLARAQDRRVATQVAVQIERHLRASEPPDQVRLLWDLLRADPNDRAFGELALMVRVGWRPIPAMATEAAKPGSAAAQEHTAGTLRDLCRALGRLDQLRTGLEAAERQLAVEGNAPPVRPRGRVAAPAGDPAAVLAGHFSRIAKEYHRAAAMAAELAAASPGTRSGIAQTPASLTRNVSAWLPVPEHAGVGVASPGWLDAWQAGLLGNGPEDGLRGWMAWLGTPLPVDLESTWHRLVRCLGDVRDAAPFPTELQVSEARAALASLDEPLRTLPWPESLLLAPDRRALERWLDGADARAIHWGRRLRRLHQKMDTLAVSDVAAMVAEFRDVTPGIAAGGGRTQPLPSEELHRLHRWLLDHDAYPTATEVALWLGDAATLMRQQHLAERAAATIRATLDSGDEATLERDLYQVRDEGQGRRVDALDPDMLHRVQHFLLRRIALRSALRLRREVRARLELPHPYLHLGPLLAGILAGPVLVLDVGEGWTQAFGQGIGWKTASVVVVSFAGALALVVLPLLSAGASLRTGAPGERSFDGTLIGRVATVFGAALVIAFAASAFVLWTTGAFEPAETASWLQAAYWTPLSLFLGLFLGLVLQGRGPAGDG